MRTLLQFKPSLFDESTKTLIKTGGLPLCTELLGEGYIAVRKFLFGN